MLISVVTTAVMLAAIDRYIRLGRVELAERRARYALFALRDRLRREALAHTIRFDAWFRYMDTTLTRAIDSVHEVNVWKALVYSSVYGRLDQTERAYAELQAAMADNQPLQAIYLEYTRILWRLVEDRHASVRNLHRYVFAAGRAFTFFDGCFAWLRKSKRRVLEGLITAPETSTLLQYAPVRRRAA